MFIKCHVGNDRVFNFFQKIRNGYDDTDKAHIRYFILLVFQL